MPGGGFEVEDLGSTNGTMFQGARIQKRPLRDGDRLDIANAVQISYFELPEPIAAAPETTNTASTSPANTKSSSAAMLRPTCASPIPP